MTAKLPLSSHTVVRLYEKNRNKLQSVYPWSNLFLLKKEEKQKTPFDKSFLKLKFSINFKMLMFSKSLDTQEQTSALPF